MGDGVLFFVNELWPKLTISEQRPATFDLLAVSGDGNKALGMAGEVVDALAAYSGIPLHFKGCRAT